LKKAFLMVAGEFKNTDQTDAPTVINGSFWYSYRIYSTESTGLERKRTEVSGTQMQWQLTTCAKRLML
jgi:hypothetical protein